MSEYCILLIAVERYIAVFYPLRYNSIVTTKRVMLSLILVNLFIFVTSLSVCLALMRMDRTEPCTTARTMTRQVMFPLLSVTIVPLIVTAIIYCRIFYIAQHQQNKINTQQLQCKHMKRSRHDKKLIKMMLKVFIAFYACWLQFLAVTCILPSNRGGQSDLGYLIYISNIFMYCNSFINPVIYAWGDKNFRTAFKTILMCKREA